MENWVEDFHPSLWMAAGTKTAASVFILWKFPSDFFQGIPGPPGQKGDQVSETVREHLTSSGAIILIFVSCGIQQGYL